MRWNTLPKYYFLTFIQQLLHDVLLYKTRVHNHLYGLDNFGSSNLGMYALGFQFLLNRLNRFEKVPNQC